MRHANASCSLNAIFSKLLEHGITKEVSKKKLVGVGADGASVNSGKSTIGVFGVVVGFVCCV